MKEIELANGRGVALVDDDNFDRLAAFSWHASRHQNITYAQTNLPRDGKKRKRIRMHSLVLQTSGGITPDHVDGNGLNNQRYNLRPATKTQQQANTRKISTATSKYKGVSLMKTGKWAAQIKSNGRNKHLGCFHSEEEAARVYDNAAIRLWGDFARTNFGEP